MQELVLDGEAFSVSIARILTNCRLFPENRVLLAQPKYAVQSRVSVDSFRRVVGAIGGTGLDITDGNASDLELLSDEFKFTTLWAAVVEWWAVRPSPDADTRLITASLEERLSRTIGRSACLLGKLTGCIRQRSKAARDIDRAAEQRRGATCAHLRARLAICGRRFRRAVRR
jgi:hypothetical protein